MSPMTNPETYLAAMTELEDIVERLREAESVDVDELVKDVIRAKTLIGFCDGKIAKADMQLKTVLEELKCSDKKKACETVEDEDDSSPLAEEIPF